MFLSVIWIMTAAVVGFTVGRASMYGERGLVEEEYGQGESVGGGIGLRKDMPEKVALREDAGREDTGRENTRGENTGREDVRREDTGRENTGRENTGRKDTGRENTGRENTGRKDTGREIVRRGNAAYRTAGKSVGRRGRVHRVEEDKRAHSVGSPVSGQVTAYREGERPTVVIRPDGDRLYAPSGGKITRLFPMGNAFLFSTEFGAEMYIQVGDAQDDLLGRYYRPRVIQNEVVGKGKLLLEFDRQGLEAEGTVADVSVCVEGCSYGGDVRLTAGEQVRIGEEILQVREPSGQASGRKS